MVNSSFFLFTWYHDLNHFEHEINFKYKSLNELETEFNQISQNFMKEQKKVNHCCL